MNFKLRAATVDVYSGAEGVLVSFKKEYSRVDITEPRFVWDIHGFKDVYIFFIISNHKFTIIFVTNIKQESGVVDLILGQHLPKFNLENLRTAEESPECAC